MISYSLTTTDQDLEQILNLQLKNLERSISQEELKKEGFVTVHHDFDLLKEMNTPFPHILAKNTDEVIGYALVMLKTLSQSIEVLVPMFEEINALSFQGRSLKNAAYFIMGQICIQKGYRGQGVFSGLYQFMKKQMSKQFEYVITEVSSRNVRSLKAHQKVGFQTIHIYQTAAMEKWHILLWDWNKD